MPELGHTAYYVRNLERSVAFYQKVVGLTVVGRMFKGRAAVLSGGRSHHELLLIQISTADGPLTGRRIGLYHTGWKVGTEFKALQEALDRAQTHGTKIDGTADHGISFSLYVRDPDNNEVELFVDNPNYDWEHDTSWIEAPAKPLTLPAQFLNRNPEPQLRPVRQPPPSRMIPPVEVDSACQYRQDEHIVDKPPQHASTNAPSTANLVQSNTSSKPSINNAGTLPKVETTAIQSQERNSDICNVATYDGSRSSGEMRDSPWHEPQWEQHQPLGHIAA